MRELQVVDASELACAFGVADYSVKLDGDTLPLRVGELAADLEAYWPAQRYVLITAWNPAARPHSESTNYNADASLVAQIDAMGAPRQAAWAQDGNGDWAEPGWLVADLDLTTAERLAREFGQTAVLAWQRGEPVRLRMLVQRPQEDPDLRAQGAAAYTDWVE